FPAQSRSTWKKVRNRPRTNFPGEGVEGCQHPSRRSPRLGDELVLHHKILSPLMMHHNRRGALLRLQQEPRSQPHAHVLLRLEQREQLCLVLQIWTRGIAEGIARTAILLMKQIANVRRVLG